MATKQQSELHQLIKDIIHASLAGSVRNQLLGPERDTALERINPRWSEVLRASGAMPAGMLNATDFVFTECPSNKTLILYPSTMVVVVLPALELMSKTIPLIPGLSTPSTCGPG